ncbi:MAG: T9SS type A sorting domain-containing protein [Bacteroidetes bacterium]|nr:T9SS type A sorting domain-containing protein [Bacteroidota bacterium]
MDELNTSNVKRMKRNLLPLLFLCFSALLSAQTYRPLPENARWLYQQIDDYGQPTPISCSYALNGDTTLSNHTYRKMIKDGYSYEGAIRDSARRIYYRGSRDITEHLLCNFNFTVGDTIIAPYPLGGNGSVCDTVVVIREDSFLMNDGYHRMLVMEACAPAQWIEGVGNHAWIMNPYLISVSGGYRFTSFYDSTKLLYPLWQDNGYSYDRVNGEGARLKFNVYPNPAQTSVSIVTSELRQTIRVTNVLGKVVFSETIANGRKEIDVSQWPSGLYFINNRKFVKQ